MPRVRYSRCSEGVAVDREARGGEGGADAADRLFAQRDVIARRHSGSL
jgi:hypothetical protein